MTAPHDAAPRRHRPPRREDANWRRNGLGTLVVMLSGVALLAPLRSGDAPGRIGMLLSLAAVIELAHGFRRSTVAGRRAAWSGGGITFGMGLLLINAPFFAGSATLAFMAGWFALDGFRNLLASWKQRRVGGNYLPWCVAGVANCVIAGLLIVDRGQTMNWTVAIAAAARIFGVATNICLAPVFSAQDSVHVVVDSLRVSDLPELRTIARGIADQEAARSTADWGWIVAFLATLFAIHVSRMGFDRSILGIMAPGFAVLGDAMIGLLIAFALVIPATLIGRRASRWLERRVWSWCLEAPAERWKLPRRTARYFLTFWLRFAIRLEQAQYSFRVALSRGLQIGLPLSAIIAATVPVWGMSWYFDTENWAAGIWNSWAEERTDTWRAAMAAAVWKTERHLTADDAFAVHPPGIAAGEDFSFVVIGDTGEGDASQHALRAAFLDVVRRDDVKFVVLSSDVVYPTGAMRDYEANFWLPFMGTTKPVYAIPGNHDWYDALDGFTATFFEPDAARLALRARVAADKGLSSTTDARIEDLIATATRLQRDYDVPTQRQKAPFFQFQTDAFALFAIDTGVAKRIDAIQMQWLRRALDAARGKTKMAVLGHPFYAGGHYQATDNAEFAALHELLREHAVAIVMAGDTHDLEYYFESRDDQRTLHFVNGGGGAYLSFGTALAWPAQPATKDWAFYPSRRLVEDKIEQTAPAWKRPAWWWTQRWNAWPFSAEWLSAAFDVNAAPFYQSFVEVRVEPTRSRLRLIPYGVHGRLRWRDFQATAAAFPAGVDGDAEVEWTCLMPSALPR